jgi:hypothetical protein
MNCLDAEVAGGHTDPRPFPSEIACLRPAQDVPAVRLFVIVRNAKRIGPIFAAGAHPHYERPGTLAAPVAHLQTTRDCLEIGLLAAGQAQPRRAGLEPRRSYTRRHGLPSSIVSRQCPEPSEPIQRVPFEGNAFGGPLRANKPSMAGVRVACCRGGDGRTPVFPETIEVSSAVQGVSRGCPSDWSYGLEWMIWQAI